MTSATPPDIPINTAGRIGFVLAVVTVVFSTLQVLVSTALPYLVTQGASPSGIGAAFLVLGVISILLSLVTTVFGIIGAVRRHLPRLASGIALGVGVPGLLVGVIGLVAPTLVGAIAG